jgi:hypothetical protein
LQMHGFADFANHQLPDLGECIGVRNFAAFILDHG